jgi:hypothetical protein
VTGTQKTINRFFSAAPKPVEPEESSETDASIDPEEPLVEEESYVSPYPYISRDDVSSQGTSPGCPQAEAFQKPETRNIEQQTSEPRTSRLQYARNMLWDLCDKLAKRC